MKHARSGGVLVGRASLRGLSEVVRFPPLPSKFPPKEIVEFGDWGDWAIRLFPRVQYKKGELILSELNPQDERDGGESDSGESDSGESDSGAGRRERPSERGPSERGPSERGPSERGPSEPGRREELDGGSPEQQDPQESRRGDRRREGGVRMYQMQLYRPSTRSYLQLRRVSESRLDLLQILQEEFPGWQVRRVRIHDVG